MIFNHNSLLCHYAWETMIEMFGERGRGARSAVGVASLPRGWAVEVEAVFELQDNL